MPIHALVARHHQVGLENLERLSARPLTVRRAVAACPGVRGVVVLATCNRFELYLDVAGQLELRAVTRAVADALGLPGVLVSTTLVPVADPVRHVCEVAAGLDSMVLGEREIAGQVRRAAASARAAGVSTGALERLFGAASWAARRVATDTGLGALGRSVVDVALDAAGVEAGARCVLVGTGSYAGAVVAALARRDVARVEVFSAAGRAAQFAAARGLGVVAPDGLAVAIAGADLVVTCSGGPGFVLRPEHLDDRADGRDLAVVDLALRRDVDPAVGELSHVRLVSLRELAALDAGPAAADLARARELVAKAAAELVAAERSLAWGRDLASVRRQALDGRPREARRDLHAALHPASAAAHAAARAGDRPSFDRALELVSA